MLNDLFEEFKTIDKESKGKVGKSLNELKIFLFCYISLFLMFMYYYSTLVTYCWSGLTRGCVGLQTGITWLRAERCDTTQHENAMH